MRAKQTILRKKNKKMIFHFPGNDPTFDKTWNNTYRRIPVNYIAVSGGKLDLIDT